MLFRSAETKKAKKAVGKTEKGPRKVDRSQEEQLASIMLTGKQKKVRLAPRHVLEAAVLTLLFLAAVQEDGVQSGPQGRGGAPISLPTLH